jgi:hypothetical protein
MFGFLGHAKNCQVSLAGSTFVSNANTALPRSPVSRRCFTSCEAVISGILPRSQFMASPRNCFVVNCLSDTPQFSRAPVAAAFGVPG